MPTCAWLGLVGGYDGRSLMTDYKGGVPARLDSSAVGHVLASCDSRRQRLGGLLNCYHRAA